MYLSKSIIHDLNCPTYYKARHAWNTAALSLPNAYALTGTHYHDYKAQYIRHLIEEGRGSDEEWARRWLATNGVTEDARSLIEGDIPYFKIDPDTAVGVEMFLGVDDNGEPTERQIYATPGRRGVESQTVIGGTIDFALMRADTATLIDWKCKFSVVGTGVEEAAIYALLWFAWHPQTIKIEFGWWFARLRLWKATTFTRDDLPWITRMVQAARVRQAEVEKQIAAGETLDVNPYAGLCPYCPVRCPLYDVADRSAVSLAVGPIQTREQAVEIAQRKYIATIYAHKADEALRRYIAEAGSIDMGGGFTCALQTSEVKKIPLKPGLELLGLPSVDLNLSPRWDVNLDSLTIGGLSGPAKAKKRAGMAQELANVAKVHHRTTLVIKKGDALLEPGEDE